MSPYNSVILKKERDLRFQELKKYMTNLMAGHYNKPKQECHK